MTTQRSYPMPPPLLMERLKERYTKVSMWSFGSQSKTEVAYCDEYAAYGFMVDDVFHLCGWHEVLPVSEEKQRLNEALTLVRTLLEIGALGKHQFVYKGDTMPFDDMARKLLKEEESVYS